MRLALFWVLLALALPCSRAAGAGSGDEAVRAIDQRLERAWRRAGITPARPADDAAFLRRAYLDLLGTIPAPEEVTAFLADRAPDRRRRLIDRLLSSPRHALRFTDYWEAVLFARGRRSALDREAFRAWLGERLGQNAGWDRIVRELLTASGTNSARVPAPKDGDGAQQQAAPVAEQPPPPPVHGAVNFLLQYEGAPHDLSGIVAREFLGVRIQCAQCHNHPTERWKQADFRSFAAAFSRLRATRLDPGPVKGPRRVVLSDAPRPVRGPAGSEQALIAAAHPTALDGTDLSPRAGGDPRAALAAWLTSPRNPWFARELVNRYWAYFMGRGFFEPLDDQRPGNPPVLPDLLDLLARDFIAHGFDLRRLVRQICLSRPYALSAGASTNGRDRDRDLARRLWSRHRLRPLGPVELLDSIVAATSFDRALARAAPDADRLAQIRVLLQRSVAFAFDVDEEISPPDFTGTVQQELMLMNGSLINLSAAAVPGGLIDELSARPDGEVIEALFLRVLSRRPAPQEVARLSAFLAAPRELIPDREGKRGPARVPPGEVLSGTRRPVAPDPLRGLSGRLRSRQPTPRTQALEDLLWALLNSSEFTFRH